MIWSWPSAAWHLQLSLKESVWTWFTSRIISASKKTTTWKLSQAWTAKNSKRTCRTKTGAEIPWRIRLRRKKKRRKIKFSIAGLDRYSPLAIGHSSTKWLLTKFTTTPITKKFSNVRISWNSLLYSVPSSCSLEKFWSYFGKSSSKMRSTKKRGIFILYGLKTYFWLCNRGKRTLS